MSDRLAPHARVSPVVRWCLDRLDTTRLDTTRMLDTAVVDPMHIDAAVVCGVRGVVPGP